jgi:hypothetical protein
VDREPDGVVTVRDFALSFVETLGDRVADDEYGDVDRPAVSLADSGSDEEEAAVVAVAAALLDAGMSLGRFDAAPVGGFTDDDCVGELEVPLRCCLDTCCVNSPNI